MTALSQVVASTELTWRKRDGSIVRIAARIGVPHAMPTGEWGCPLELDGIHPAHMELYGVDSVQALSLALKLVHHRLRHLLDAGEHLAGVEGDAADGEVGRALEAAELDAMFGISR